MRLIQPVKQSSVKTRNPANAGAYYSSQGGIVFKTKTGRTSVKNPVLSRLNANLTSKNPVKVNLIYSRSSRVVRGTDSLLAVRTDQGKGWLTESGRFMSEQQLRDTLYNVDNTIVGDASGISLLDAYDKMSPAQRAKFADAVQDYDWDEFWNIVGSDDPDYELDRATDRYFELVDIVGSIMKW